jgi:hypothetical protein
VPDHGLDPRRRIRHARRITGFFRTKAFDEFRRHLGKVCFCVIIGFVIFVDVGVKVVCVVFVAVAFGLGLLRSLDFHSMHRNTA